MGFYYFKQHQVVDNPDITFDIFLTYADRSLSDSLTFTMIMYSSGDQKPYSCIHLVKFGYGSEWKCPSVKFLQWNAKQNGSQHPTIPL